MHFPYLRLITGIMIANTALQDIEAVLNLYKMASDFKKTVSGVQ